MSTTIMPPIRMRPPVPRSGWMMVRPVGNRMMSAIASSDLQSGGSGRSCNHHAQVIGTASLSSSEGWKRMIPRSSQRCAPLPM
jgi:hypothetical protein